jgi:hypothetical protein
VIIFDKIKTLTSVSEVEFLFYYAIEIVIFRSLFATFIHLNPVRAGLRVVSSSKAKCNFNCGGTAPYDGMDLNRT